MNERDLVQPIPGAALTLVRNPKLKEFHDLAHTEGFLKLDLEDSGNARRLPKTIERNGHIFMVAKVAYPQNKAGLATFYTIDLFIKPSGVIMVAPENPEKLVDRIKQRLGGEGEGNGFRLAHAVLDEIVDGYLAALDAMGETIQHLEAQTLKRPATHTIAHIFQMKKTLSDFRRNSSTMREAVNTMARSKTVQEQGDLAIYLHDVAEHLMQAIELVETYRDALSEALDLYLSVSTNRINDIVKVLAVYGTIALPLVVITSMYGMNVALPLAKEPAAFWIVMGAAAVLTAGMLVYFRKRHWF
ncbi:MAG: magnesium transporter CorA family protein [bacterium]|nr:magnesium transporter CorA family protein [bacterium]